MTKTALKTNGEPFMCFLVGVGFYDFACRIFL